MAEVYQLVSSGASPVTLAEVKNVLRISSTDDDTFLQNVIDACTEWGESYTRRSFRAQVWTLLLDELGDVIELRRQKVDTITSITRKVLGVDTVIDSTLYYLKQTAQGAEILLGYNLSWPDDADIREQAYVVNFTTIAWTRHAHLIHEALMKHIGAMYSNRGDCMDAGCQAVDFSKSSGAQTMYDMMAIAKV